MQGKFNSALFACVTALDGRRASSRLLKHLFGFSLSIAFVVCATAAAQPATFIMRSDVVELGGRDVRVDVYEPGAEPSGEVAIVAHGVARSRARHRDLGQALAAAGVTAVIPDLPYILNHWANGDAIEELVHKLESGALGLPPIEQSRLVLVGTSAGGLSTVLAAAKLPKLAGWVGLDPVDRTGSGIHAASRLTIPAVVMLAEPSICNLFGSARSIARAVPDLLRSVVLSGASHCDFEGPTNRFCEKVCGGSSSEMQSRAREETVRAVVEMLRSSATRPMDGVPEFAH
jgi:dienelactone hydrolase